MIVRYLALRVMLRRARREYPRLVLLVTGVGITIATLLAVLYAEAAGRAALLEDSARLGVLRAVRIESVSAPLTLPIAERFVRALALGDVTATAVLEREGKIEGKETSFIGISDIVAPQEPDGAIPCFTRGSNHADGDRAEAAVGTRSFRCVVRTPPRELAHLAPGTIALDLFTLQVASDSRGELSYLLLGREGKDPESLEVSELAAALASLRAEGFNLVAESDAERARAIDRLANAFRANIRVLVGMTLLVCLVAIFNLARLSMFAFARDISILRTLGTTRLQSFLALLAEPLTIGVLGGIAGLSLGRPLTSLLARVFLDTSAELFDGVSPARIAPPETLPYLYLAVFLTGPLVSVIGAMLPAWWASSVRPTLATRVSAAQMEPSPRVAYLFAGCAAALTVTLIYAADAAQNLILGFCTPVAVLVLVAALASPLLASTVAVFGRSIVRVTRAPGLVAMAQLRGTNLSTGLALAGHAIGVAMLVALGVFVSSFRTALVEWIEYSLRAEIYVNAREGKGIPEEAIQLLRTDPRVRKVARFSPTTITIDGRRVQVAGTDFIESPYARSYNILEGTLPTRCNTEKPCAIASEPAARKLRIAPGSRLVLFGREVTISGVFRDFAQERGLLLMPFETFEELGGPVAVESLAVYLAPGANAEETRAALESEPALTRAQLRTLGALRSEVFRIFDRTFRITNLLAILVALICGLGFVTSMAQQIWERRVELKTLGFLGLSQGQRSASIAIEGLVIASCAIALGIAAGIGISALLVYLVNPLSFGWTFDLVLSWHALIVPVSIVLGATLLCSFVVALRAPRLISSARVSSE